MLDKIFNKIEDKIEKLTKKDIAVIAFTTGYIISIITSILAII